MKLSIYFISEILSYCKQSTRAVKQHMYAWLNGICEKAAVCLFYPVTPMWLLERNLDVMGKAILKSHSVQKQCGLSVCDTLATWPGRGLRTSGRRVKQTPPLAGKADWYGDGDEAAGKNICGQWASAYLMLFPESVEVWKDLVEKFPDA